MRYVEKKRREFEAEQFVAMGNEQIGDEKRLLGFPWTVHGVGPNVTLRLYRGTTLKVRDTDWVVRDAEGGLTCVTDAEFRERFEVPKTEAPKNVVQEVKSEPVVVKKEA